MQKVMRRCHLKNLSTALLVAAGLPGYGQITSDLVCSYSPSAATAWGGEANAQVNMANGVIGSNALNDQSGTGANFNIVGYVKSTADPVGQDTGYVEGLLAGDASFADVRNYGASVGADQIVYTSYNNTGAAGVAAQPGWASAISQTWWWLVVVAHETGGHNYGRTHPDGVLSPKTIMLHNYCGGGAAWPYFYSNPNLWYGGVQLIGNGATTCPSAGTPQSNGGDNSSCSAQYVANFTDHTAIGPALNNVVLRWCFTNTPGSAPAGTTNYDLVSGAPAVICGNGATYTGNALRIPGGTTGNVPMTSMSAYVDLPNGIVSSQTNITIEIWATPLSAPSWARIMEFGRCTEAGDGLGAPGEYTGNTNDPAPGSTTAYDDILLTADESTSIAQQRLEARLNSTNVSTFESSLATTPGVQHYYAITFADGTGSYTNRGGRLQWYRDGVSVGFVDVNFHLISIADVNDWLGRSQWSGDSQANNDYAEVRISNVALSPRQVMANFELGANYNPGSLITLTNSDPWGSFVTSFNTAGRWSSGAAPAAGNNYQTYNYRLLTPATGSAYTFGGNALTVTEGGLYFGGTASSTITVNNLMVNNAEVHNRGTGTFTLAGNLTATNSVVVNAMNGPMNLAANLSGNGSVAYVGNQPTLNGLTTTYTGNQVTLTGNNINFSGQTIVGFGNGAAGGLTIDSEARLGANPATLTDNQLDLNRGTLTTTATMALSNTNRGILLDVSGGGFNPQPGTTLTLACPLFSPAIAGGATGGNLNKSGSGTLILNSPNSGFNGMLYVDSASSSANDGVVRLANSVVMANAHSPVYIRDSGSGSSILQLDGTSNSISLSQTVSVNGRSGTLPAIESLAGTNTLSGGLSVYGSGTYAVQVDAGTLNIAGTITSSDGGADTVTFQGNGAVNLNGSVANGSGTMSVNKTGNGMLSFGTGSSYSGSTTVSQGTLALQPSSTPVLHLTFNNATGSNNGSVITNTGTGGSAMNGAVVGNGATIVNGGRFGNALSLNGAGGTAATNIVLINNKCVPTDASGNWTLGYWIKTSTAGAVILYQGDGSWSSAGQTTFYLNNNGTTSGTHAGAVRWAGGWLTGTAALNNNAWHFVALVDNAGTESIYVDGNVDAVTSVMANPLASDANQIWIGGSPDGGDGGVKMSGLIDEVYLYNRALSQAEVQSLYNNNAITNIPINVLPVTTPVTVASSGVLDLAGVSQTVAGLSGGGMVTNSGGAATLTISNTTGSSLFSGKIADATSANAISLVASSSGTSILAGANSYHGSTTINGGILRLSRTVDDSVLHLTFNNPAGSGNGTVITNSGLGGSALNGAIVGNGATIVSGGRYGNALSLNGVGGTAATNIVLINNKCVPTDASATWTVGYWIKTSMAGAVILYQGDGSWSSAGQTMYYLNNNGTTSGTHAGAVRWAGGWLTGSAALNNNAWHFVTLVDNAGTESIYVDGNVDAVTSTMANPLASGANQIWIGGSPDGGDGAAKMNGLIDEVYMFNRALSQAEIQALYNYNSLSTNSGNVLPATTPVSVAANALLDVGGVSQTIASLTGVGTVTNTGSAATLTVSNSTGTTTFSGSMNDASAGNALSFVQSGSSTNILSGANGYHGSTIVGGGTLLVNGSLGSGAVTVTNGTLGGKGVIAGAVTIQSGGTLAPGGNLTVLTVNNNVALQPGSTTVLEISKTAQANDRLFVTGNLSFGGALSVTNLSGTLTAGDSFQLFQAGQISGAFGSNSLPALNPGLAWNTVNLTNGVLSIVQTTPTNLMWNINNTILTLSWPAAYVGWRLEVQTNSLDVGLGTNWTEVPGSRLTNNAALPVDTTQGSVFYRLVYP